MERTVKQKNNKMISIVAKFEVNEGEEEKFLNLVSELSEASRAEKGCIEYILHKDKEEGRSYCLIEKWKDQDTVDEHNSSRHFTAIVPLITEIAKVEVDVYHSV